MHETTMADDLLRDYDDKLLEIHLDCEAPSPLLPRDSSSDAWTAETTVCADTPQEQYDAAPRTSADSNTDAWMRWLVSSGDIEAIMNELSSAEAQASPALDISLIDIAFDKDDEGAVAKQGEGDDLTQVSACSTTEMPAKTPREQQQQWIDEILAFTPTSALLQFAGAWSASADRLVEFAPDAAAVFQSAARSDARRCQYPHCTYRASTMGMCFTHAVSQCSYRSNIEQVQTRQANPLPPTTRSKTSATRRQRTLSPATLAQHDYSDAQGLLESTYKAHMDTTQQHKQRASQTKPRRCTRRNRRISFGDAVV